MSRVGETALRAAQILHAKQREAHPEPKAPPPIVLVQRFDVNERSYDKREEVRRRGACARDDDRDAGERKSMNTPDIIAEAKKRLAECEAEADKLRRMIAAAEGVDPVRLVPVQPISITGGGTTFQADPNIRITWTIPREATHGPEVVPAWWQQDLQRFGSFTICASSSMAWNGLPSEFGPAIDVTALGDVWVGDKLGSQRPPHGRCAS